MLQFVNAYITGVFEFDYSLPEGFCIYFNLNLKKTRCEETLLRSASYKTIHL
jgi:hypothetical protein